MCSTGTVRTERIHIVIIICFFRAKNNGKKNKEPLRYPLINGRGFRIREVATHNILLISANRICNIVASLYAKAFL